MENSKSKLSHISDNIFIYFTLFFITLVWVDYLIHNIKYSFIISILVPAIILLLFSPLKKIYNAKQVVKKNTRAYAENISNYLLTNRLSDTIPIILKLFTLEGATFLSYGHFMYKTKDVIFAFDYNTLDSSNIYKILRDRKYDDIIIFCLAHNLPALPDNITVTIYNLYDIVDKFKTANNLSAPEIHFKKPPKYSLKDIFRIALNKSTSKKYFYSSIVLILTSFFTPYYVYYITISTILMVLSVISRFNKKFN